MPVSTASLSVTQQLVQADKHGNFWTTAFLPSLAHANYPSDLPKTYKKDMDDLIHSGKILPFPPPPNFLARM
jgi:hypothetical protein